MTLSYPPMPDFPGFDLNTALHRLRGKRDRLEALLHSFADRHKGVSEDLRALLDAGSLDDARRLAHQINGAAANLGATALSQRASSIESTLNNGEDVSPEQLAALHHAIVELRTCVAQLQHASQTSDTNTLLEQLRHTLQYDLSAAAQILEQLDREGVPEDYRSTIATLQHHFEQLEFETMQQCIHNVLSGRA